LVLYWKLQTTINGLKTIVKVNDRGPHAKSRLIDLSYTAAKDLGLINAGIAKVTIKVISLGKPADLDIIDDQPLKDSTATSSTIPDFKPELLEKNINKW
jgi:rare lipoprotein A